MPSSSPSEHRKNRLMVFELSGQESKRTSSYASRISESITYQHFLAAIQIQIIEISQGFDKNWAAYSDNIQLANKVKEKRHIVFLGATDHWRFLTKCQFVSRCKGGKKKMARCDECFAQGFMSIQKLASVPIEVSG